MDSSRHPCSERTCLLMSRKPEVVDADFEIVNKPDRSTGRLEAWAVDTKCQAKPYSSLRARLFHYWWLLAKAAGADDDLFDMRWQAQLAWAIATAAWMSALLALAIWAKTTAFGTRHG